MNRPRRVQRVNSASDSTWGEIQIWLDDAKRVASHLETWNILSPAAKAACEDLRTYIGNMQRLQEVQRGRYSEQADDGIIFLAEYTVPAVLDLPYWPDQTVDAIERIRLSMGRIASKAKLRQAGD